MGLKHRYNKKIEYTKIGTGIEQIDDDIVDMGTLLTLESIAVVDETTALTYIRIGCMTPAYFELWEEQQTVSANELIFTQWEHTMREGQHLRCEISGGAASDKIKVYLQGYWRKWKEEE